MAIRSIIQDGKKLCLDCQQFKDISEFPIDRVRVNGGKKQQESIITAVSTIDGTKLYKNRPEFIKLLHKAFKKAELDVKSPLLKAILAGLSEKDETADICIDTKGNPEPDTDLRDTEQIPLKEDIAAYIEREVLPYAPDAWVDEGKTKKGYEIRSHAISTNTRNWETPRTPSATSSRLA